MSDTNNGVNLYKHFIDGLIEFHGSLTYKISKIRNREVEKAFHRAQAKELVSHLELSDENLHGLIDLIEEMQMTTIHDFLVYLYDNNYSLLKDETKITLDPFGREPYQDYMYRLQGEPWTTG